jgi:Peptidase family C25
MFTSLVALVLLTAPGAAADTAADTVVVCPDAFRPAMTPWLAFRTEQGHPCQVVSAAGTADEIRQRIRRAATGGTLRFVVLVGDAPAITGTATTGTAAKTEATDAVEARQRRVPTFRSEARLITRYGPERDIATDNPYADLDDDLAPDVAVGRLSVDSPAELTRLVAKIVAYERTSDAGQWRRKINLIAGVAGFGPLADSLIESSVKRLLTDDIPPAYATTMTYASWRSPYFPDPRLFCETTIARLNEGCLFWIYVGHGHRRLLDQVRVPDGAYDILAMRDVQKLKCRQGPPIAMFLSCYAGAFDAKDACLAEEMLRADGGPVAVVCGSRITMPYATTVLGAAMLQQYFVERRATLGELIQHAKRSMVLSPRDDPQSKLLDSLAALLNPSGTDLAAERREHLLLFNLLGDPLLRLPRPAEATVVAAAHARPGSLLEVAGDSPIDGQAQVELVVRRDRLAFKPPPRQKYGTSPEARAEFQRTYDRANDGCLASQRVTVAGGKLRASLAVPASAQGECHVRVFIAGREQCAIGCCNVRIGYEPPEVPPPAAAPPMASRGAGNN